MNNIKTVFFDLDGTLVDNFQAIYQAYCLTAQEADLPQHSFEEVKSFVGGSGRKMLVNAWGEEHADRTFAMYRRHYPTVILEGLFLYDGVKEFLQYLDQEKITLAVYTNKHADSARAIVKELQLSGYFVTVLGAEDTPWLKPNTQLTLHLLSRTQSRAEETLMIGDSYFDIETGRQVGLTTWMVATGTHSVSELQQYDPAPHQVFADMKALHQAFEAAR